MPEFVLAHESGEGGWGRWMLQERQREAGGAVLRALWFRINSAKLAVKTADSIREALHM
jgi:hypothetical protein